MLFLFRSIIALQSSIVSSSCSIAEIIETRYGKQCLTHAQQGQLISLSARVAYFACGILNYQQGLPDNLSKNAALDESMILAAGLWPEVQEAAKCSCEARQLPASPHCILSPLFHNPTYDYLHSALGNPLGPSPR